MKPQAFPLGTNANPDEWLTGNRRCTHWSTNLDFSTAVKFLEATISDKEFELWKIVVIPKLLLKFTPKTQKWCKAV